MQYCNVTDMAGNIIRVLAGSKRLTDRYLDPGTDTTFFLQNCLKDKQVE